MAKVKVKLKHVCNASEHPGGPGDTVHVDAELAQAWEEKGGCEILTDEPAKPAAAKPTAKPAAAKEDK